VNARAHMTGVEVDEDVTGNRYIGTADDLINAGVISAAHLPEGTSTTFFDGTKVDGRKVKGAQFERWMQVRVWGKAGRLTRFVVTKGVTRVEREERERATARRLEEISCDAPKPDIGIDRVREACSDASSTLEVGTHVLADGDAAVVTGAYELRRVREKDGEYLSPNGGRINYRWGYVCRLMDGKEFFFAAHDLASASGRPTHLRIAFRAPKSGCAEETRAEQQPVAWPLSCVHEEVPC
jgi:hypothetical protein